MSPSPPSLCATRRGLDRLHLVFRTSRSLPAALRARGHRTNASSFSRALDAEPCLVSSRTAPRRLASGGSNVPTAAPLVPRLPFFARGRAAAQPGRRRTAAHAGGPTPTASRRQARLTRPGHASRVDVDVGSADVPGRAGPGVAFGESTSTVVMEGGSGARCVFRRANAPGSRARGAPAAACSGFPRCSLERLREKC